MRKLGLAAFLAAAVLSFGCALTDYPVIFDSRGADGNAVLQSFYDKAYVLPTSQVATIWNDGSDELYTEVTQDWKGDQYLYTFNNFDPTSTVLMLDQTYCDPLRQSNCAVITSWNPDTSADNPFDYALDTTCSGARSISLLLQQSERIGECGSGLWADKQGLAYQFSTLEKVNFRGTDYYHLPIDGSVASFGVTGQDGAQTTMPVFGRFNAYLDHRLRTVIPMTPNTRYQLNWLNNWVAAHGNQVSVDLTYGSLNANFKASIRGLSDALNRL